MSHHAWRNLAYPPSGCPSHQRPNVLTTSVYLRNLAGVLQNPYAPYIGSSLLRHLLPATTSTTTKTTATTTATTGTATAISSPEDAPSDPAAPPPRPPPPADSPEPRWVRREDGDIAAGDIGDENFVGVVDVVVWSLMWWMIWKWQCTVQRLV